MLSHVIRTPLVARCTYICSRFKYTAEKSKPFDKILIANRGEIACRIMRSCKRMGVKTVAIYSEPDADALHVRNADEAFCVGKALSKESYLRMEKIVEIALSSGAQAIHPGYGFLSENASFNELVESSGLVFIGPPSMPMLAMGDKINSKKIAKDAGCFVIPGFDGEVADEDEAVRLAKDVVGFPVMIKASAGGGGKGMRIAYSEAELREAWHLSKTEALSSFGDDRMLIERFIEDPHHIEIQVLADSHGNVVAFPERECSVQRRNQKVIEESPSCLLSPATRKSMQEQAIMLCKATGYRSAGTVEMLADGKQNFYFLEMNTRLQVEHPITELVTGEDLVEHMLWIAAGRALPERLVKARCLQPLGWAIEARVYAEDPARNFLPSTGSLITYKEPDLVSAGSARNPDCNYESDVTVRLDAGVSEGSAISVYYDPMISKLCAHASTRSRAITAMETALDEYVIRGLENNLQFLHSVFRNPKFRVGNYTTKFIQEEYPKGFSGVVLSRKEMLRLVAASAILHQTRLELSTLTAQARSRLSFSPAAMAFDRAEQSPLGGNPDFSMGTLIIALPVSGDLFVAELTQQDEAVAVDVTSMDASEALPSASAKTSRVLVSSLDWKCESPLARFSFVEQAASVASPSSKRGPQKQQQQQAEGSSGHVNVVVQYSGRHMHSPASSHHESMSRTTAVAGEMYHLRICGSQQPVIVRTPLEHRLSRFMLPPEVKDTSRLVRSPMPGTLMACYVSPGENVEVGQQLAVVEAMKMQNVLRSSKAGVIKSVLAAAGAHLKVDQVIIEFD